MTQKIYCATYQTDSGYVRTEWFKNKELLDMIIEKAQDENSVHYDRYRDSEVQDELIFPDSLDLESCGFVFADNNFHKELKELNIIENYDQLSEEISKENNRDNKKLKV